MIKAISSLSNPLIRQISLLSEKSKERRKHGIFIIEGQREILLALKGGYEVKTLLFNPAIVSFNQLKDLYGDFAFDNEIIEVTNQIYDKLAYREGTEGVLGVFYSKELGLENISFPVQNPLILVAEAPEKPGNIGALLRTVDAAGVDACIIANANTDMYNPNIIRSSIGCVFTTQIAVATTNEIIDWLKKHKIQIVCATISDESISYYNVDYTLPNALVVGTESTGLSKVWIDAADVNVMIPMRGQIDSMNVSVSAAILIYEALRQRM